MRRIILLAITAAGAWGQTTVNGVAGQVVGGAVILGPYTIGSGAHQLPAAVAGNSGWVAVVTDAANGSDCTVGLGTSAAQCRSNGSAWVPLGGGGSTPDILRFSICVTAGCGSETTINYIATMGSGTFTECSLNLATTATGSSVIVDVQDGSGTSIFGATKLVVTVANGTAVEYQATFASSPQNYARGNKFKAVVIQNDSGGTAQGGAVQCR
jgi:hypothetical protein